MLGIFELIFPLFGLILLGFAAGRITKQPVEGLAWLNTFIVYVALPALFFRLLQQTPVEELASWGFIGVNIGVTFAILLFTFLLGLIASRGSVKEATIQGLAGAYGNIGYMGPALAILTFGEQAAVPVALIFCFENIMHFVFAPAMMAVGGGGKERSPVQLAFGVVKRIVTHPFMLATAAGVLAAFLEFTPPAAIDRLIESLSLAAAPCALFAMGVTLALRPLKRFPPALSFIVPIKLIVHPAAMYLALTALGPVYGPFDPIWLYTAVLLAALPSATNVFVIAQQYGVWVERASASVMITTAASVLTVSTLLYLITTGALPTDPFGQ